MCPPIQQSSPWYISNRSAAYVCSLKTHTKPLTVALFVTPPNWKLPTCSSTVDWISKLCYIHTMGSYSTMRNEQPGTTCPNTVLSQENQTQNDTGCGIPFIKCIKTRKKVICAVRDPPLGVLGTGRETEDGSGVLVIVCCLVWVMVTCICCLQKIHGALHLGCYSFLYVCYTWIES